MLIDGTPYDNPRKAGGVGMMLTIAAKHCGFSPTDILTTDTAHTVLLELVSHPTRDDVLRKIVALGKALPAQWLRGREEKVADGAMAQLSTGGLSVYLETSDQSDQSQRSLSIAFLDKDFLEDSNRDAIVWYAIFAAITGTVLYSEPVDNNDFSYLIGGGALGDVAGDNGARYVKLCRALPIISAVCDKESGQVGPSMATVLANLPAVVDLCQPGSDVVKLVMRADAISQTSHGPH